MNQHPQSQGDAWKSLRERLEREWLPAWVADRRWFQAKSRHPDRVQWVDGARLATGGPGDHLWMVARIWSGEVPVGQYQIPLAMIPERSRDVEPAAIVARTSLHGQSVWIVDALAMPELPRWLVGLIESGSGFATERGAFTGEPTAAFPGLASGPLEPVRLSRAEQSHSNIIFGDGLLLKVFRGLADGINPDVELTRALTERTSFRNMPALAGAIGYAHSDDSSPGFAHAAMLQQFVPSRGQGWEWMRERLVEWLDADRAGEAARFEAILGETLDDVAILARRTAELHRALASIRDDPEFEPIAFGPEDWIGTSEAIRRQAASTRRSAVASGATVAYPILDRVEQWLSGQEHAINPARLGERQRIHGDLHLGQTLRTDHDYIFLDFEGEPTRPVEERRRKQSPLRDVAGMLRSFDYVAFAAAASARSRHVGREPRLGQLAREWSANAEAKFLEVYSAHDPTPGGLGEDRRALLDRLLVEKALYELDYELNNRPDWADLPLGGLTRLLER